MEFVILVISLCVVYVIVKNRNSDKLPIPKSRIPRVSFHPLIKLPIINAFYHLYQYRTGGTNWFEELAENFGHLFEIDVGPTKIVVTGDANIVQKILSSTEPTHLNKTKILYDLIFIDFFKNGLVNADFSIWAPHRKMLNRCFTHKCCVHYVKIMNKHARDLATNLKPLSTPASIFKAPVSYVHGKRVHNMIYFHSVKIISQILMDTDKYAGDKLEQFSKTFQAWKHLTFSRITNPQLLFPPYWYFHPMKREFDYLYSYIKNFLRDMLIECKKEKEAELLKTTTTEDETGFRPFRCVMKEMICCGAADKEIYDEIGTILGAGHETTVIAIQMLLQHLALNRYHQSRCREEVNAMFEEKRHLNALDDEESDITMDDLIKLKYLERCILESGRLTSTVPFFMRTLGSPLKLDDELELPSGTNICVGLWILHKNPKYWEDPNKFDPDRFLPENVKARHPYAFIPFSGGARNCIGYKVALLQIKTIMIWLLRKYEVRSDDKLEDVRLHAEVTLHPERDYRIKFIPLD